MLPRSVEQSLGPSEPVSPFDQLPWIKEYRAHPEIYEEGGFGDRLPLYSQPEVRYAMGFRGSNFLTGKIQQVLFWNKKEECLEGAVYFGANCEGPPGRVHGGCIAATMDSTMGFFTVVYSGLGYYTLNLNTNYTKFVPLQSIVRFKCTCTNPQEGKRKIASLCQFFDPETNELLAESTAVFYHPPKDGPVIPLAVARKGMQSMTAEQFVEYINTANRKAAAKAAAAREEKKAQAKL
eukprot:TRINITY_DN12713_c0_g1_i1.p1 TRINITY_DN12713_c0_g1~~TRINITY_DN12713_c0_g1_i1.p1  ORF type:complete len:262 (+),score=62.66 TRINITY_DN12713_c0_g1_i1:80-787(+)